MRGSGACLHFNNTLHCPMQVCRDKSPIQGLKMHFRPIEKEVFGDVDPEMAGVWTSAGGELPEAD